MADVKNIITLGIGANPGSLLWFMTSGLESGAVAEVVLLDVALTSAEVLQTSLSSAEVLNVALSQTSRTS